MPTDPAGSPAADIDAISGIVASCAGVAALSATARSYLPGRTVPGVSLETDRVDVYVVAHYQEPLTLVTEQVAEALAGVLAGRALFVHIEDIVMPGETAPVAASDDHWTADPVGVMTVPDDEHLRSERRAFIRDHHPDRGGDPDEFIEGLHRLAESPRHPSEPVIAYRSRRMTPARWLRRMRARRAGTPPRRLH